MSDSKINCLTAVLIVDQIREVFKDDYIICPFPKPIKEWLLPCPYQPVVLLTKAAARPKSVRFCGSRHEHWWLILN